MMLLGLLLEVPPLSTDQININSVIIIVVGALVTLVTPWVTARALANSRGQDRLDSLALAKQLRDDRAAEREEDRKDRAEVANKVADAATKVEKVATETTQANTKREELLNHIVETSEATHAIVNSQRTQMLRQIAVLARALAKNHPRDKLIQEAARVAEEDLKKNIEENEQAAKIQKVEIVSRAPSLEPIKVQNIESVEEEEDEPKE